MSDGAMIRKQLRSGELVFGTHVSHEGSPHYLKHVDPMPLDFVFIDTEHAPIDRTELSRMCSAFEAQGFAPVVRIQYPDAILTCQALDGGAHGIVAPYVETVEQVRAVVGAAKYRPLKGELLHEVLCGTKTLNEKTQRYLEAWNRNSFVLIGIESVTAVERLPELLAVPGLDGVFIGPHDLSISMGIPEEYDAPEYNEAICRIISETRRAELGAGMHIKTHHRTEAMLAPWLKAGLSWILYSHDYELFTGSLKSDIETIRSWK